MKRKIEVIRYATDEIYYIDKLKMYKRNNFKTIQDILKENEIDFLINSEDCNDDDLEKYNIITLKEGTKNIEAYPWFFTWLFFDKENGRLKKIGIYK